MSEYKIQEISKKLALPASTIRFWENEFSGLIEPARTNGGQRRYSEKDIDYLKKIKELLYSRNMSISQAKLFLKEGVPDSDDKSISGKSVLITGGTGFIGKHLCRHLLGNCNPGAIRIFSRDEKKQHDMKKIFGEDIVRYFIGDVRDAYRLKRAMEGADIVIHTAALKQIPSCDFNPFEAVKTNIQGVENLIDAAIDVGVKKVLAISTSESVSPLNLYGTTRLCAEKIFTRGGAYSGSRGTRFCCVRHANIIGSPDNLIKSFEEQRPSGQICIADPSMTSFWMTMEQSLELILKALELMQGGEIFIASTPSVKNIAIAKAVAPECDIKITGLSSQSRKHELLITEEEGRNTVKCDDVFVILPPDISRNKSNIKNARPVEDGFTYKSNDNDRWITAEDFRLNLYGHISLQNNFSSISWNMENSSRI